MLNEGIYMDFDAYDNFACTYAISCDEIQLSDSKIEIKIRKPDRDSLPKRIVINGCEYVMKEEK
jgi:hypothetical protein